MDKFAHHISIMDLLACFRVMVICMLTVSPGFGLSLTCESEWKEHSEVKCTCNDTHPYFIWRLYSGTQKELASVECKLYETCSGSPHVYATKFGNESTLTIPSVTVDMAKVECEGMRGNVKNFKLPVFAPPLKPVCLEPAAVELDYLFVPCHSRSVFPKGVCKFNIEGYLESRMDELRLIELNVNNSENNGKYLTLCAFFIPLRLVRNGYSNGFQVGVTPNLTAAESFTVYSNRTHFSYQPAHVLDFTVNSESKSVMVDVGQPIVFKCLTEGWPMTNVSIIKNYLWVNKKLFNTVTYELNGTIESATCGVAGRYTCSAFNGDRDSSAIEIQVRDDLQLDPSSELRYQVYTNYRVPFFRFKFNGCPGPTKYSLTRVTGDSPVATRVGEQLYTVRVSQSVLTLMFPLSEQILEVGENSLILTVKNEVDDELKISFDVQYIDNPEPTTTRTRSYSDKYDDDDDDNSGSDSGGKVSVTASAIGTAVGCLVVLGVCIVALLCYRRKRKQSLTRRPHPVYGQGGTVDEQTRGTGARYTSPDVIFTTGAASAPSVELMTTNDDIRAYQNFRLPPSYETVVHNAGYEGLAASHQETNEDSENPKAPPPSYASVQAVLDPPPPYSE